MSYILDALKKSEKERKHGTVPGLLTTQDTITQESKKRSLWPYLIVAALLLNAMVLLLWFGPWNSKKHKAGIQSTAKNTLESKVTELSTSEPAEKINTGIGTDSKSETDKSTNTTEPKTANKSKDVKENQTVQTKTDLQEKGLDKPAQKVETKSSDKVSPVVPKQNTAVADVTSEKKSDTHPAPIKNKIYNLSELPQSIQQNLPAFSISVFLYSDDTASRMVRVNGQMMKEGQYLSEGLKLEEIIPSGLIFTYYDYRFRIGLK